MPILDHVAVLALRPLVSRACTAVGISSAEGAFTGAIEYLRERFTDHGQKINDALRRANERAWRALEIALAGESLLSRLDRNEDKAFREQVRSFLDAWPADGRPALDESLRAETLRELRAARKAGVLDADSVNSASLAERLGPLARHADPIAFIQAEWQILDEIAGTARANRYDNLARFLTLRPANGESLLAVSVRYFFRREVEQDPALFQGLDFAQLERIGHSLDGGLSSLSDALAAQSERIESLLDDLRTNVLDMRAELARQSQQLQDLGLAILRALQGHQLEGRVLRPSDSLSIHGEAEMIRARELVGRYRAIPAAQRRELPALLNAVGKLEVMSGDFAGASNDFRELSELVSDSSAQAEAHHHRFRAAVEQQLWDDALDALKHSARLDPTRFAQFPLFKFEPERILGAGGFGVAILCRNRHSGSRVVVKVLRTDGLERVWNAPS